jgi:hypothetical protein
VLDLYFSYDDCDPSTLIYGRIKIKSKLKCPKYAINKSKASNLSEKNEKWICIYGDFILPVVGFDERC